MNFWALLKTAAANGITLMSLKIINWDDFISQNHPPHLQSSESCAMTIGVFDAVHLGHQALIRRIVEKGPNPTVVTFRENPKKVLSHPFEGDLYSLKQKLEVFDNLGVRQVILIDFSRDFSKLKGKEFLNLLHKYGRIAFLAIGSNFRCGFHQDTGAILVKEMNERRGIPTELVPMELVQPVTLSAEPVSSSRIRAFVASGNIKLAAALMGRNFDLDLSDIRPELSQSSHVYDLRSVQRIVPANGAYQVRICPGSISGMASTEEGKVFLPREAEKLEFISTQFRRV